MALIIVYHDEFLGLRHLRAAITSHPDAIEIDTCLETSATINSEVPVHGICPVGRNARLAVHPQLPTTDIEDIDYHIHVAPRAVVVDDEGG